jgi:hypothetical protein
MHQKFRTETNEQRDSYIIQLKSFGPTKQEGENQRRKESMNHHSNSFTTNIAHLHRDSGTTKTENETKKKKYGLLFLLLFLSTS